jgi:hypothetical protein
VSTSGISTHTWRRSPLGGSRLTCSACDREWLLHLREPRDECNPKPKPDKAVAA